MGRIINGKAIAASIEQEIATAVAALEKAPALAVLLVGDHPPSQLYVKRKVEACQRVGIRSILHSLPDGATETLVLEVIDQLNQNPEVDGILVQLPLPKQINRATVISRIAPSKDVDGLHPLNVGKLLLEDPSGFIPCTPLGIKVLLERANITVTGKHVVILGRSQLVGKPLAALLMQNQPGANATVTVVHSKSQNLKELTRTADILIAAMGQPEFITADMIAPHAYIIDVGINKIDGSIVGDVDFETVKEHCAGITPVPGGVGPMTIAMLLSNTLKSYATQKLL